MASRTFATSSAINAVARSAKRKLAQERSEQALADAVKLFSDAGSMASRNVSTRRELAIAKGRGMYTGTGAYKLGQALRKFGAGKFGQALQSAAVSRLTGGGMYTGMGMYASTNDIIAGELGSGNIVPLFQDAGVADEGIVVSRREYVSEIYGPPLSAGAGSNPLPFVLQSFSINPGLEATFPWLSQIASNYDEYELKQLIFTFKTTTTESSTAANGQVGTIIMATNYNAAAPVFTDKVTMLQYAHSNSGRITESLQHGVECDPEKLSGSEGEYVRNNPVVTNQDLKTYDHGKFQIAVANCAAPYANVSLGELWVSYTVVLRKPKFYQALGLGITKDIFCSNGGESGLFPLGNSLLSGQQNNLGSLIQNAGILNQSSINITFPAPYRGKLKIMWSLRGTGVSIVDKITTLTFGNVIGVSDLYGFQGVGDNTDGPAANSQAAAATGFVFIVHVDINIATNGVDNVLRIILPSVPTTVEQSYVDISEYNGGFSYSATGLSVQKNDAPVFVNSSGVITLPS